VTTIYDLCDSNINGNSCDIVYVAVIIAAEFKKPRFFKKKPSRLGFLKKPGFFQKDSGFLKIPT